MRSIIDESYVDAFGNRVNATKRALKKVKKALGSTQHGLIDSVMVAWDGRLRRICFTREPSTPFNLVIHTEQGKTHTVSVRSKDISSEDGCIGATVDIRLEWGYHRLYVKAPVGTQEALIISAPVKAYGHPKRRWGFFTPIYALSSNQSQGIGDLGDLQRLMGAAYEAGADFIGTLPLLATYPDMPSPYSPLSMFMFNELLLDLSTLIERENNPGHRHRWEKERTRLNRLRRVGHVKASRLKHDILERMAPSVDEGYDNLVLSYARFRARKELGKNVGDSHPRVRMHAYAQTLFRKQLEKLRRPPGLYLDLPVGVHRDSFDTHQYKRSFCKGLRVGAPPDPGFPTGQDWGFLPLHPERIREEGYDYLITSIRNHMRYADFLRIDHVMRFHRLYVIPDGLPSSEGVYIRYHPDEFYAIINLESRRNKCSVIGENLGTVEPEVNRQLDRHALKKMFILLFSPANLPSESNNMAYLDTHDTPTFASMLSDKGFVKELRKLLRRNGYRPTTHKGLVNASLKMLGDSSIRDICVNLEDLWLEKGRQNTPGTVKKANWSRKLV